MDIRNSSSGSAVKRPIDTVGQVVALGQAHELAALKRQNAIARNSEELVVIARRILEWERAGYIRGGRTVGMARTVLARIDGAAS